MQNSKYYIIPCLFLIGAAQLNGQEVVGAAGESKVIGTTHVAFSVGEPVVGTRSIGNNNVTQGFHQPEIIIESTVEEKLNDSYSINIFPNPASDVVNIYPKNFNTEGFMVEVLSVAGQKIMEQPFTNEGTQLDISGLESSNYILIITNKEEKYYQNFKLIKSY